MSRGFIIPIGGAEEKLRDPAILRRVVEVFGGAQARIAIIPTASQLKETGPRYRDLFLELGAHKAEILPFAEREDGSRMDWLRVIEDSTGVFMTGGNQLRLSTTLGGTPAAELLRTANLEGLHIAGTSAGAAILSEHMIAYGDEGATPRADMVTLAPGLGFTRELVVDQHFRQRDRLGRLLTALAFNPRLTGIGLDEDTAAFLGPDDVLEVAGSGAITVVDASELSFSSMDSAARREPVCIVGARLHVLIEGATYDLGRRTALPPPVHARSSQL